MKIAGSMDSFRPYTSLMGAHIIGPQAYPAGMLTELTEWGEGMEHT